MVEKPNFRLPGCVGLLGLPDGFPDKPTSPAKQKTFINWDVFIRDKMAATTARSIAGSSTLMPGYVEENVFGAKPETGPFSRTAKIIFSLLAL
jgi:hypothetical protein